MRFSFLILLFFIAILPFRLALASGVDLRLEVVGVRGEGGKTIASPEAGKDAQLLIRLTETGSGKAIGPDDLVEVHEKLFHFFGFDQSLSSYVHEHPRYEGGLWVVSVRFPAGGKYRIWSDVAVKDVRRGDHGTRAPVQGAMTMAKDLLLVQGPTASAEGSPSVLPPETRGMDGPSTLSLDLPAPPRAGIPVMIPLTFSRNNGTAPAISPYLGAMAHALITSLDGQTLIHAHPMEHRGRWMLHAEFSRPGDYRAFVQFLDGGVLRTVKISVRVEGVAPEASASGK